MCGIAGFLLGAQALPWQFDVGALLGGMGSAIAHRGPDDADSVFLSGPGLGFVHRRLSIIDTSPTGRQPMTSVCGRYTVVFNGEIYNFLDLKDDLRRAGLAPAWKGTSDTEAMLAAFSAWGIEASLKRFNGMFAIAVWDHQEGLLTLARDIAGEKPLYYGLIGGSLVFGSELRALQLFPGFQAEIDELALGHFVRFLNVPSPFSIFRGVKKLSPGHFLTIAPRDLLSGLPAAKQYWSAFDVYARARAAEFHGSEAEAVAGLDRLLRRSIKKRMISDVPLGAFLSGGFDSSLIVALMQAESSQPVRTFTIGFDDAAFDESPHAARVARHLGTAHTEARVTAEDALDVIARLPGIYDEPFADSSQIPTAILCAMARRELTVALSGDAGDELFGGYQRYFATAKYWSYIRSIPLPLRGALADAYGFAARSFPQLFAGKHKGWRQFLNADVVSKIRDVLSAADEKQLYEGFLGGLGVKSDILAAGPVNMEPPGLSQWNDLPGDCYHKMMFMDFMSYLPNDILTKVDRAAMAVGLETRIPFLDPDVIAYAWGLPLPLKLEAGRGKLILRKLVAQYIPAEVMERPKQGFGLPIGDWLRGPLRPWAEELLNERRLRSDGYFDAEKVRGLWAYHLASSHMGQPQIWPFLVFNSWMDSVRSCYKADIAEHIS